eukprot:TRINITY_DN11535_c0_g1_i1.p1 TRINITY_DN11535_c0_g1~~TRINITY_DN11535_c0_g1_i1.p1  ORF type:complete len:664 (+),score=123.36 TRINITY_DN11535_c0_g1_i1:290-1993(+)
MTLHFKAAESTTNSFCLPNSGIYTLTPQSCFLFNNRETFEYDTTNPTKLDLAATMFRVTGSIVAAESSSHPPTITCLVRRRSGDVDEILAVPVAGSSDVYEYQLWAELGEKLEITPRSDEWLFYPSAQTVAISNRECPEKVAAIHARPGIFVTGTITPHDDGITTRSSLFADVVITVFSARTNEIVGTTTVTSGVDGKYVAGPFYDDDAYYVKAQKDGFFFVVAGGDGKSFVMHKLGSIAVQVGLEGALLSLSGSLSRTDLQTKSTYRNNNVTDATGNFQFSSLFAGQYFLRPMLKEYVFDPISATINMAQGEDVVVTFSATRVAYSCYGHVHSLNKEPEKFVAVAAVGKRGDEEFYEEGHSDNDGNYRVRGLVPGVTYDVHLKTSDDRIERSSPAMTTIVVEERDTEGVDFIAFRKHTGIDLTGEVDVDKELVESLHVQLFAEEDMTLLQSIPLSMSRFFDFPSLDKGRYLVRLHTLLSSRKYSFTISDVHVDLQETQHVQIHFSAVPQNVTREIAQTPIYAVLVGAAIVFGGLYWQSLSRFFVRVSAGDLFAPNEQRAPSKKRRK